MPSVFVMRRQALGATWHDTFTRPDETPLAGPYARAGGVNLVSGQAVCTTATSSFFLSSRLELDGYVEAVVTAAVSSNSHLLVSLVNGTGDAYIYLGFEGGTLTPFIGGQPVGGSDVVRASGSSPTKTTGTTYRMRLTRAGDLYTGSIDGTDVCSYTDPAFADCGAIAEIGLGSGETCTEITVTGVDPTISPFRTT